jgi:hypothetical protein
MRQTAFPYFARLLPPAPSANVSLNAPGIASPSIRMLAQLDSGSDRTILPQGIELQLGLIRMREMQVEGLSGVLSTMPTFLVEITIDGLSPITVEALFERGEQYVLLGRDVLNLYSILHDGPTNQVTIIEP